MPDAVDVLTPQALRRGVTHLRRCDPVLAQLVERVGPLPPRPARRPTLFAMLGRAIVYQQISGAAARAIHRRLVALCGGRGLRPAPIRSASAVALRAAGLSRQKAASLRDLARHVDDGLTLRSVRKLDDEAAIVALSRVRGVGRWTAEMLLMFQLGRPDLLPVDDLGIRKSMQRAYRLRELPRPERMQRVAEPWRPWRTVACFYLWRALETLPPAG
jgi:3-methyladenine DNA glycosylase/8-oxoguanine DNA glycosylase